jgi:hypothetical protein
MLQGQVISLGIRLGRGFGPGITLTVRAKERCRQGQVGPAGNKIGSPPFTR